MVEVGSHAGVRLRRGSLGWTRIWTMMASSPRQNGALERRSSFLPSFFNALGLTGERSSDYLYCTMLTYSSHLPPPHIPPAIRRARHWKPLHLLRSAPDARRM